MRHGNDGGVQYRMTPESAAGSITGLVLDGNHEVLPSARLIPASRSRPFPSMSVESTGSGAGLSEFDGRPIALGISVGHTAQIPIHTASQPDVGALQETKA